MGFEYQGSFYCRVELLIGGLSTGGGGGIPGGIDWFALGW